MGRGATCPPQRTPAASSTWPWCWQGFTIAIDYFQCRYPGTTIVFDISMVYIFVAFGAVLLNNLVVEAVPLNVRIVFGYVVSLVMLLFVSFFEIWWPDTFPPHLSYRITLFSVAIAALGCTVQQSSFYGYTGMLPKRYTHALLLDDQRTNTMIFFVLSIFFIVVCLATHLAVQRTTFIQSEGGSAPHHYSLYLPLKTGTQFENYWHALQCTYICFYLNLCRTTEDTEDLKRITLEPAEDGILVGARCGMGARVELGSYGGTHPVIPIHPPSILRSSTLCPVSALSWTPLDSRPQSTALGGVGSYGGTITSSDSTATFHSASTLPVSASVDPLDSQAPSYRVEHIIVGHVRAGRASAYTRSIRMWSAVKTTCSSSVLESGPLDQAPVALRLIDLPGHSPVCPVANRPWEGRPGRDSDRPQTLQHTGTQPGGVVARWQVGRSVWQYMLAIALAYFVTLCLYPGIVTEVVSCRMGSWMPVVMMAVFNLFDFIGKVLASVPYDWTRRQLVGGASRSSVRSSCPPPQWSPLSAPGTTVRRSSCPGPQWCRARGPAPDALTMPWASLALGPTVLDDTRAPGPSRIWRHGAD
ncbi:Equilibrative nucleoside transporter 4 [Chionoecetes opilio]|uniref:Equilibrative nucleoside transporter 4 n=1 Tax=Chionoecetes opilio TaxID=41210 RepID=A0A8J5CGA1_CHIOP|nr:Equilibrative nucleoside transporter 4 [Chionoecetes opilio]